LKGITRRIERFSYGSDWSSGRLVAWAGLRPSHFGGVRVRVPFMTVTLNYLNGLVDKAGCMDLNIEVHNVARITNVFAQRLKLWSSRSMGWTSSVTFRWGAG
jgi:hypothetical protein